MPSGGTKRALECLRQVLPSADGALADGQLLARFLAARDEASFAALMRRHGPMVLGVCRRLLRHEQDAEDTFQATFFILARKAGSVLKRESLGSWLYGVAYRTALKAKAANARRQARERQVEELPHLEVLPPSPQDWRPLLDEELSRLPEKYRGAVLLCDLEGRWRKEAARQLGVAEGTLSSRLATARQMLADRLARRGLALSAGAFTAALSEGAALAHVPGALAGSTVRMATLVVAGQLAAVSTPAAVLTRGVLKAMLMAKLKVAIGAVLVAVVLGAGGFAYRAGPVVAQSPPGDKREPRPETDPDVLRKENELLKLNLQVVLEKVRAQEAEIRALKGQTAVARAALEAERRRTAKTGRVITSTGGVTYMDLDGDGFPDVYLHSTRTFLNVLSDPVKEVEAALKALQGARDKEAKRRAADALDKVTKRLREQLK